MKIGQLPRKSWKRTKQRAQVFLHKHLLELIFDLPEDDWGPGLRGAPHLAILEMWDRLLPLRFQRTHPFDFAQTLS